MFLFWFSLLFAQHIPTIRAYHHGFNYGTMRPDGGTRTKEDFVTMFNNVKAISSSNPNLFNSARLFKIRHEADPNQLHPAIDAAAETNTTLLLGLWCGGAGSLFSKSACDAELEALMRFMTSPHKARNLVIGVSVGSEDIYRQPAAKPEVIEAVKKTKEKFKTAKIENIKIGHADVFNSTMTLFDDVDFVTMNTYPFWEQKKISMTAVSGFFAAYNNAKGLSQQKSKEIWITETGWAAGWTGPQTTDQKTLNLQSEASVAKMQTYWNEVACKLIGQANFWWFEMTSSKVLERDEPWDWGVFDSGFKPRFDLSCQNSRGNQQQGSSSPSSKPVVSVPTLSSSLSPSIVVSTTNTPASNTQQSAVKC